MATKTHQLLPRGQQLPMKEARTPQVANDAGGFVWQVDATQRLERFLILGSVSGSYYATPKALTVENCGVVEEAIAKDGPGVVRTLVEVSLAGRAPRQDPALFALALCLKTGDEATRKAAEGAVQKVCRTGTHLFQLADIVKVIGGWGRLTRRAVGAWYADKSWDQLAYQAVKYQRREGWSHRDLLRLCHVKPESLGHGQLYYWICSGKGAEPGEAELQGALEGGPAEASALRLPLAMATAHALKADPERVANLVRAQRLPRECVPGEALNHPAVWRALLDAGMGMTALLRNLAKMTQVGLFKRNRSARAKVCELLGSVAALRAGRVHPLAILVARNTSEKGSGVKGKLNWKPEKTVLDALEQAFHLAFQTIVPTGKRHFLAVDVSGSMSWTEIAGMTGITPRIGAAAMALVTRAVEKDTRIFAFSDHLREVPDAGGRSLDGMMNALAKIPMGGTDCALPMLHAMEHRIPVDVFVVYTDSETWFGSVHPAEALRQYRRVMGIPARLIVVGMVANAFTIADPDDPGMLDVVGFDTSAPALMADFVRNV